MDGQVRFEWLEGGFFLVQHVDLVQGGERTRGVEYIGYDPATESLASHYFGSEERPLAYTWQIEGDTLTIWHGAAGSPASYTGTFSEDGNVNAGRWVWPGGGYESTMTRLA